jgi:TPP-dependent 2-oxoacid decarboxylase
MGTPHATSAWSKSLVDETSPSFLGLYAGGVSSPHVRSMIEDAPVLVVAGIQFTDLNSGFFTQRIPRERTIELGADTASVGNATYGPISIGTALSELALLVSALPRATSLPTPPPSAAPNPTPAGPLSQASLWAQLASFLRPGDIVLADQGTSFYGMATQRLPANVTFLGQPLWASIGYTVPALLGAMLGAPGRRAILLVGDGAAQMTVQELSTVLRLGLPAIVVVVDNDGYTVERAIHGPEAPYNDIATWDWTALPAFLGPHRPCAAHKVDTTELLAQALDGITDPAALTLIQAVVPKSDVPELLTSLANAAAAANAPAQRS